MRASRHYESFLFILAPFFRFPGVVGAGYTRTFSFCTLSPSSAVCLAHLRLSILQLSFLFTSYPGNNPRRPPSLAASWRPERPAWPVPTPCSSFIVLAASWPLSRTTRLQQRGDGERAASCRRKAKVQKGIRKRQNPCAESTR